MAGHEPPHTLTTPRFECTGFRCAGWADEGVRPYASRGDNSRSRRLPVDGVNVLAAGIAEQERGIDGCKGEPAAVAADGHEAFQIGNLFCLVISDPNADHAASAKERDIFVLAELRARGQGHGSRSYIPMESGCQGSLKVEGSCPWLC